MLKAAGRTPVYVWSRTGQVLKDCILSKRPDIEVVCVACDLDSAETERSWPAENVVQQLQTAEFLVFEPKLMSKAPGLLQNLTKCRVLQSTWAGVETLFAGLANQEKPKYSLARFGGVFGQHIAEYVVGHIIARERMFKESSEKQHNKEWNTCLGNYRLLSELSLGIIGLGDIGKDVAKAVKTFGMQVLGYVRTWPRPKHDICEYVDAYKTGSDGLKELLGSCDYILSVLPSTPHTKDLLSGDMLSHCKDKQAVFINVGRGSVISDESLLNALSQGWLGGAVLDVFNQEPLPQDNLLWSHPKVKISPHVAAMSLDRQVCDMVIENYDRYLKGEQLLYVVDWDAGY